MNDNSEYYLYDLSSGDYPISNTDSSHDSKVTFNRNRYFALYDFGDIYALNNYGAFEFIKGYEDFAKLGWADTYQGNYLWVDSERDYGSVYDVSGYFYNDIDPEEEEPIDYSKRPLSFSKEQEILSPLAKNYVVTSTYGDQTVKYNFGLDLTADYNDTTDDYIGRKTVIGKRITTNNFKKEDNIETIALDFGPNFMIGVALIKIQTTIQITIYI